MTTQSAVSDKPSSPDQNAAVDRVASSHGGQPSSEAPGWLGRWTAPIVSGLCLLHCMGMGLLAPLLPAAVSTLALSPALEWGLWFLSMTLAAIFMRWPRPSAPRVYAFSLIAIAALGLWGLFAEAEWATRLSLAAVAVLQITVTLRRRHRFGCSEGQGLERSLHRDVAACAGGSQAKAVLNSSNASCAGACHHSHVGHHGHLDAVAVRQKRTLAVVCLAAVTMVAELAVGWWTGSLALLADGWHMATHVGALGLAWLAYSVARRLAASKQFAFGADKTLALAGYTNALGLAVVALLMIHEAWERFVDPQTVRFGEALPVAFIGLAVNLVSARILHPPGHHDHDHDHNMRAAYLHVLADAVTSVFAVVAILGGHYLGLPALDPLSAVVGAVVILVWSYGLLKTASSELLDRHDDPGLSSAIRAELKAQAGVQVCDLRVWPLGRGKKGCTITVDAERACEIAHLRQLVEGLGDFEHLVIEVRDPAAHSLSGSTAAASQTTA